MGRLVQLKQLLLGEEQDGTYECLTCRTRFERWYQVCPECEGYDIQRIEWTDGRPGEKSV